jgi:flagellar biosynthesis protein FlhB
LRHCLLKAFKAFAILDFFLAAVFLCNKFFAAALSKAFVALLNKSPAEASFFVIASLHFLTAVFRADFLMVFFSVFFLVTLTLFIADLMFGKPFTSCDLVNVKYFITIGFKMQGLVFCGFRNRGGRAMRAPALFSVTY